MLPDNPQSELVIDFHGEIMTTSLAIAEGVDIQHKNVLSLIRKYVDDLSTFGRVAFQTRPFETAGGRQWVDVAWLNEQQATFLLTLMRNSPIVVEFKKALVHAFFALRDRVRAAQAAPAPFGLSTPAHAADHLVSADRIFRCVLRSSRSAGVSLPRAIRRAANVAQQRTGIDLLTELDIADKAVDEIEAIDTRAPLDPHGALAFCDAWLAGALPLPVVPCRSEDLYAGYVVWRSQAGQHVAPLPRVVGAAVRRPDLRHLRARHAADDGAVVMSGFVLPESELMPPAGITQFDWLTLRSRQFGSALTDWRAAAE